jgi:hypothetical protein
LCLRGEEGKRCRRSGRDRKEVKRVKIRKGKTSKG